MAEVSLQGGEVTVHDIWVAIDPGSIVNPAIIEAQVQSAVALGLSSALLEEVVYEQGVPRARNYDGYPILPPAKMPKVHVRIVESGAPMGGIGEPGLPGVPRPWPMPSRCSPAGASAACRCPAPTCRGRPAERAAGLHTTLCAVEPARSLLLGATSASLRHDPWSHRSPPFHRRLGSRRRDRRGAITGRAPP